jgi:hypothetical protein
MSTKKFTTNGLPMIQYAAVGAEKKEIDSIHRLTGTCGAV